METTLLPSFYLGPVSYYSALLESAHPTIEQWEHYGKQTYRNRCRIATANKIMDLTIPTERSERKIVMRDVRISYQQDWQKQHWNAIASAYNSSPYFEYFADELHTFYENKEVFLLDFNTKLHETVCRLMQIDKPTGRTEQYEDTIEGQDLRNAFNAKGEPHACKFYHQVFEGRFGFLSDLSILDLVLNEGPESYKYL